MRYVLLASLTVCLFLYTTCTNDVTGNSNKNQKQTVPAMLYNPGGSPAVHAKVRFFPINYNPRTGSLSKKLATADSATTDSTGSYSVKLDTGTYNVLASGDSGVVYQDSITVTKDSAIHPPADTLKTPGGLRGKVRLQPGDDARTVFILFMGTNTWGTPEDSTGKFTVTNMAQGTYKVRVLTTLDAYVPKDTTLSVAAGAVDSLAHDIVLQYTGIPGPTGLMVSYDTLRQTVILSWTGADTSMIAGYNVYRAIKGQNFSLITQTPLPDTVTTYRDSTVTVGTTYQYEVVSRNVSGLQSTAKLIPGDTMKVVSSSLVTTTFTSNLINAISDTASINDTIKVCLTYSNPTRKIVKVVWYADSLNSPLVKQKDDSSLAGKDTLAYSWKQPGNKKIFVKVTDGAGTVWIDTLGIIIIQDAPVIAFLSADTTINHGGTVRCSIYVQQEFGTMAVEIDTANSGNFKSLGGLGLSGGKSYSFSTGSACTWDSVKVRVTDSKGNVVTKGSKVQIRISPPTIQKINSDTTIAIKDSLTFNISAIDSFGSIAQIAWDFDGNGTYDWISSTLQSCGYRYQTVGLYKAVLRLTDECQKQTYDTVRVTVVQDVPVITFLSTDTIVNFGGMVRCSVYVQEQFGTMTVEIDTANSGNYKSLGNLGLSGGESYSFSTGNACAWDSVKVRVTDSKGNAVTRGFRVRVRPRPLTITSIDSTVNTITVYYSQSLETDFTQYRIYRNTTNTVDTTSELWATITAIGTVSYTIPTPSYAWIPRYYRVFQRDTEGVWSTGSNMVYGNIINSPPTTPVITSPVNDGDSVWADSLILGWNRCLDPNGNGVRYSVFVNYNNTGYAQYANPLVDTFVQLSGYDFLSLKFKVIAYDSVGDSSAWSMEGAVFIKPVATDFDGNVYRTVTIGTQVWTVENLKTTRYNDGTLIPDVENPVAWGNLTTPAYFGDNDPATYGELYNWYAVNTGKLAPKGWHIPTDSEWTVLITYLGGDNVAGGKLKEAGTTHWNSPNTGATNETGFSALPHGWRYSGGAYADFGSTGYWWSATASSLSRVMYYNNTNVNLFNATDNYGMSVRCVRDP